MYASKREMPDADGAPTTGCLEVGLRSRQRLRRSERAGTVDTAAARRRRTLELSASPSNHAPATAGCLTVDREQDVVLRTRPHKVGL